MAAEVAAWTQRHRAGQLAIRAETVRDLLHLWQPVDPTDLTGTIGPFTQAASVLVKARRADSAGLAAAYFNAARATQLGLAGTDARRLLADPIPDRVIRDELRGAALSGIINARRAGMSVQAAANNGLVKVSGAASKLTLSGGRETIVRMAEVDDQAKGWRRVTSGSPCKWCADMAGQPPNGADLSHFRSHDHCACTAEPIFQGLLRARRPATEPTPAEVENAAEDAVASAQEATEAAAAAIEEAESIASRVLFPQEALDALMPTRGGWNTSTRAKTVAALKKTPEGKRLLKTMDSFQSSGSTAIPRFRTDIEKYLAGNADDLPQGRIEAIENFLSAVGRSDAGERTLYRGMSIPGDLDSVLAQYKPGQKLDLSVASFSTDKKLAQGFTLKGAGKKVRGATKTPVLVEWVGGGKRALPIERISKSRIFADEKEWTAAGRYVIDDVKVVKRKGTETVVVTIRQTEVW